MTKILAIDIGMGTSDILLYDSNKNIENCIKLVIPTPLRRYLKKIRQIDFNEKKNIFITGNTIGGGPFAHELSTLISENKANVYITSNAAYTIKNDLSEVEQLGFKIIDKFPNENIFKANNSNFIVENDNIYIFLNELEFDFLETFFKNCVEDIHKIDGICICAQDHGLCPKEISDRLHRFNEFKKILQKEPAPPSPYVFCNKPNEIPKTFLRLNSLAKYTQEYFKDKKILILDSSPAALLGCYAYVEEYYELFKEKLDEPYLMVNLGNNHAIFMISQYEKILALFEHHSWVYDEEPNKLETHIIKFCNGELTSDEIFNDEGNGVIYFEIPGFKNIKNIIVTGPNRNIFTRTNLKVHYSAVGGDMMMSGPIGMIRAFKKLFL